jgi:hypothetical protein
MNARIVLGASIAALATVAGCGNGATHNAANVGAAGSTGKTSDKVVASSTASCATNDLSFSIGTGDGAAGSVYEPIRMTNKGTATCTLRGYPGVSFVTGGSGDQVGAAASRNPQHPAGTVTLAPGATAESIVQVVDHMNYSPAQCKAADVSGFRVYPPGETAPAYVPFDHASSACSTDVTQLTVEAVTAATT